MSYTDVVANQIDQNYVATADNATLQGSVSLQGRPSPPDPRWITQLTVDLTLIGETIPIYSFTPMTDNTGHFMLIDIKPGTYDILVKNSHTLQNKKTVTLVSGTNTVDFGTLKEGDANNDNYVTILDFSILSFNFNKCQGTGGYDDRADFNEDNCVSILDFSLMSGNYGMGGPIITFNPESTFNVPGNILGEVLILVDPAQSKVQKGDTFTLMIKIQSGSQLIDGVQASLDFDPTKLRVDSLTGNTTAFPTVIQSIFNNTNGTIDYAAGILPPNLPISGNVDIVAIHFTALDETPLTPLTFHHGLPRDTEVTYGGGSVLTGHQDGQVQVGSFNKTSPTNGAGGVSTSPTLAWTSSLGARRYEYCYATSLVGCTNWTSVGTDTSKVLSGLIYNTTYYWHLRAINGAITTYTDGSSTNIWSFITEQNPTDVRLASFDATALPQGIQLSWQSAQENDLIGFNLYRSESPDGPQVQINTDWIQAINPGQLEGNDYLYLDASAEVGKTYYYWVEWVGNRDSELFGPVITSLLPYHVWLPIGLNR
jgi:hypothetical protein